MPAVVIYSSASGGTAVQKSTEALVNLVKGNGGDAKVVFLDAEPEKKQQVWDKSGLKGTYPLLFVDDEFIGTYETCETLNEQEKFKALIN